MHRSVYDGFAWFYDRYWAGIFSDTAVFALETLLLPYVPVHARILDLCCGTGQTSVALARRGYRMAGLDLSPAMLERARRRSGNVAWFCADARRFAVRRPFHAVYSFFDSLNHLLTPADLAAACASVHRALRPGGLFVFDLNTERGFRERWVREFRVETSDGVCELRGLYDPETRRGRYRFTLCGKGAERWRCADFELEERCHSDREVRTALRESGFKEIEVNDAAQDLGIDDEVGRVFYVGRAEG